MRLVMTTDTVGGVWTFTMTLSHVLCERGHEVHIMTGGPEMTDAQRREAQSVRGRRIHERPSRLEWEDDPRGDLWQEIDRWTQSLRRLVGVVDPHALHLSAYAPAAEAWDAPVVLTAHSDIQTWWRAVHHKPAPPRYARYLETVAAALRRAEAIVAPTRAHGLAVREAYSLDRPFRTVHNGLESDFALDLPKERRVLCAGRLWDEAKNIRAVVAAAPEIDAEVVAAGEAGEGSDHGRLRWLGRLERDAMQRELARAAVYVHPARYEPFGLLPLEAAASGCALVLSDIPTLRELWSGAALFVSPDQPALLAETVNVLLDSNDLRDAVARAGAERARALSADEMARAYESLYEHRHGRGEEARTARASTIGATP